MTKTIQLGADLSASVDLEFECEGWKYDTEFMPKISHYESDTQVGYDFKKRKRTIVVTNAFFESETEVYSLIKEMETLQAANSFELRILISGTSTYFNFSGDTSSPKYVLIVLANQKLTIEKMVAGDTQFYVVPNLIFEEVGEMIAA